MGVLAVYSLPLTLMDSFSMSAPSPPYMYSSRMLSFCPFLSMSKFMHSPPVSGMA